MRVLRCGRPVLVLWIVMLAASMRVHAAPASEEFLEKFKVLSEQLNTLEEKGYDIRKLRRDSDNLVSSAMRGDLEGAEREMTLAGERVDAMLQSPPLGAAVYGYGEWLGIYADILQKLTFILISAYFLFRAKWLREIFMRINGSWSSIKHRMATIGAFSSIGMFTAVLGYSRYGEADWGFLDLQMVFTVLAGLIGGFAVGIPCGFLAVLFRAAIGVPHLSYVLILLGAAVIGSVCGGLKSSGFLTRKLTLLAGASAGLLHGIVTYWVLIGLVSFSTFSAIVLTLVVLEMLSVYAFVVLVLGFAGDESKKRLERLLPEMKLKFLQAQINPHFLFNALNTIAAVCSREKAEQARGLIVKLSNYFRRIVKREDEWVTLQEEFDHIDSYLEIEKVRFQDALRIQKTITLSSQGLQTRIPVLIIQPLVENAIRHGIRAKREGGLLEILAKENGGVVEITIKDDGIGISPEKLKKIRFEIGSEGAREENVGEGSGIGLRNINERLKYQFGPEYQLNIESALEVGTSVKLRIPERDQEEE